MVKEFKTKNILLKHGFRRQVVLNYNLFYDLIPWSCLIDEFQYTLFGTYRPIKKKYNKYSEKYDPESGNLHQR